MHRRFEEAMELIDLLVHEAYSPPLSPLLISLSPECRSVPSLPRPPPLMALLSKRRENVSFIYFEYFLRPPKCAEEGIPPSLLHLSLTDRSRLILVNRSSPLEEIIYFSNFAVNDQL